MTKFGEGLELLRTKLLEMSSLVEMNILRSIRAVVDQDRVAANEVIENEGRINAIELEIDALAIELLALHQPMATSLRFIVAALKINTDLERMGDLALNIAKSALARIETPAAPAVVDITYIAGLGQTMLRKSNESFVAQDPDLAREVVASDDAVDELRTACYKTLTACMADDRANIKPALSLLTVVRTLERLADHATNIAEDVVFYVQGLDVRHAKSATRQM